MKSMSLLVIFAIALTTVSCSRAPKPTNPDPNEVLVEVNGVALTRAEAMRQVNLRLGGPPPAGMTQERINIKKTNVLSQVVDQFVKRTLLLKEADKLKIKATKEEIAKALEIIKASSKKDKNPTGILSNGPAGDDSIKNEIITGIRIDKLLAKKIPVKEPTDAEVDKFIEKNRKRLTNPKKGMMPRENVIQILKEQARKKELFNYLKVLQENAEIKHSASVRPPIYNEKEKE